MRERLSKIINQQNTFVAIMLPTTVTVSTMEKPFT